MGFGRQLLLFLIFFPLALRSQILDDSTRMVYGPVSTGFLYETDVLHDDTTLHHPDTLISKFHYMSTNKKNGWLWQDLGNDGTAARSIVFSLPVNAFTETGFKAFAPFYAPQKDSIHYYNTRSPYTNMLYTQNGAGTSDLGLTHARNINPNFNIALDIRRLLAGKQFSASNTDDRLMEHWDYTLSTNYFSKNRRYRLFAAFMHFYHLQHEQGGAVAFGKRLTSGPQEIERNYNTNYEEALNAVKSTEKWNDVRLYQQLKLLRGLELYYVFDFERHKHSYTDTLVAQNNTLGAYPLADTAAEKIKNHFVWTNFQNNIGFKGTLKGFKYNLGLISRFYSWKSVHTNQVKTGTEILIGGQAGYWLADSLSYWSNEVYIGGGNRSNVFISSRLRYKKHQIGFNFISKPAELLYADFQSPVFRWSAKEFNNQTFMAIFARTLFKKGSLEFEPAVNLNWAANYLYFDKTQRPQQLEHLSTIVSFDGMLRLKLKHWSLSNRILLTAELRRVDSTGILAVSPIPTIINNFNVEWHVLYAKKLDIYFGSDVYYRSAIRGMAYSPLLQSFYQSGSSQSLYAVPVADIYTKFMIKRIKLTFGFNYINKSLPTQGFFTTSDYLGLGRAFYLKVNWPLFD